MKTKTAEEIKRLREISARLKELGISKSVLKKLDSWIDKEESKRIKHDATP